ncbi:hypothetical protein EYZ11_008406 [Aspergillus tanneri]|uniref:Uncharacterized protein n=1 Tax=Aspergillus tanneri TaxID=1220188 RepID=A0A4S3JG00_9EURO|nr:hypothetical protein EYZ11_008406 [Aspergillus tanneri]
MEDFFGTNATAPKTSGKGGKRGGLPVVEIIFMLANI